MLFKSFTRCIPRRARLFKSFTRCIPRRARLFTTQTRPIPQSLPLDVLVDEENCRGYKPEYFYPANPGDILNDEYELLAKVGWGSSSTVWLARETGGWKKPDKFVAIKICTGNYHPDDREHELDMTIHLSSVKSQHRGRSILGTAIAGFLVNSPTGSEHLALVFEPLREPFWLFRRHVMGGQDSVVRSMLPLVKAYFRILLEGLDFLHSDGHIIHTDIKLDNIMITFENQSTIANFVQQQIQQPMACKTIGNQTIYRCHNSFGAIRSKEDLGKMVPKIVDFGLSQRGDSPGPRIHPIQPDDSKAPEVILGVGWSYSVDIWSFGLTAWDFLSGHRLFLQDNNSSVYSPVVYLAEMIALLGPVPLELIKREKDMRSWKWNPFVQNAHGKLCNNAIDFFGGPFFTNEGKFVREDFVDYGRSLRKEIPQCVPDEEADQFLKFMRRMLHWLPEERATAKELLSDPWLDDR